MARKSPNAETLKLLYVRSGNECSFPNCEHPIFNDDSLYIAQLCHINAANKGGQRYNEKQTDKERSALENLMFMCHRHHKETDNEEKYTAEILREIKIKHEFKFTEKGKEASKEMIRQVLFEINYFWKKQSLKKFELEDLKIKREFNKEISDLFEELNEHIETIKNYCNLCAESDSSESLRSDLKTLTEKSGHNFSIFDKVPYQENPFENRNWEIHNIGRPNFFSNLSLCLNQLKVKTIEELIKNNPENQKLKKIFEKYKNEFESEYDNSYNID